MSNQADADFRAENFSLRLTGSLSPGLPGPYLLGLKFDDDSRLYIDDQKVIDNSSAHPRRLRQVWV